MNVATLDSLPNELKLGILSYLDVDPPSITNFHDEPRYDLTSSRVQPLKSLSQVSHKWHAIVLPILFKHATVELEPESRWLPLTLPTLSYLSEHLSSLNKRERHIHDILSRQIGHEYDASLPSNRVNQVFREHHARKREFIEDDDLILRKSPSDPREWIPLLPGTYIKGMTDWTFGLPHQERKGHFLEFLERRGLSHKVEGLVIKTRGEPFGIGSCHINDFWSHLFAHINPSRIVIIAAPSAIAVLASARGVLQYDTWAFQMPFQYICFSLLNTSTIASPSSPNSSISTTLYNIRPWTHLAFNEGSSLKAYETYEYQWRRGPHTLLAIFMAFRPAEGRLAHPVMLPGGESEEPLNETSLRALEYTAIFPLHTHVHVLIDHINTSLPIERLTMRLAPASNSGILDDPKRVGKALPSDLWQEWERSYGTAAQALRYTRSMINFRSADGADGGTNRVLASQVDEMLEKGFKGSLWARDGDGGWRREGERG